MFPSVPQKPAGHSSSRRRHPSSRSSEATNFLPAIRPDSAISSSTVGRWVELQAEIAEDAKRLAQVRKRHVHEAKFLGAIVDSYVKRTIPQVAQLDDKSARRDSRRHHGAADDRHEKYSSRHPSHHHRHHHRHHHHQSSHSRDARRQRKRNYSPSSSAYSSYSESDMGSLSDSSFSSSPEFRKRNNHYRTHGRHHSYSYCVDNEGSEMDRFLEQPLPQAPLSERKYARHEKMRDHSDAHDAQLAKLRRRVLKMMDRAAVDIQRIWRGYFARSVLFPRMKRNHKRFIQSLNRIAYPVSVRVIEETIMQFILPDIIHGLFLDREIEMRTVREHTVVAAYIWEEIKNQVVTERTRRVVASVISDGVRMHMADLKRSSAVAKLAPMSEIDQRRVSDISNKIRRAAILTYEEEQVLVEFQFEQCMRYFPHMNSNLGWFLFRAVDGIAAQAVRDGCRRACKSAVAECVEEYLWEAKFGRHSEGIFDDVIAEVMLSEIINSSVAEELATHVVSQVAIATCADVCRRELQVQQTAVELLRRIALVQAVRFIHSQPHSNTPPDT